MSGVALSMSFFDADGDALFKVSRFEGFSTAHAISNF